MILFISNSGEALPIVWRLRQYGIPAEIYVHHPRHRMNYEGIIPRLDLTGLRKVLNKAIFVVFDITRPNEKTREDKAMLNAFGIKTNSPSVFGPVADKLKKTHFVIGGAEWCEDLELDRRMGSDIARKIGLTLPESHDFPGLEKGIKFLEGQKERWVLKPFDNQGWTCVEKKPGQLIRKMKEGYPAKLKEHKIDPKKFSYMLQKFIPGQEISTEAWWNGNNFLHFNHTVEDKNFMAGDLGSAQGSASNVAWIKKNEGLLTQELTKLSPWLERAAYVGPVDINAVIGEDDHKPYFLEFSPRFGWDALYCLLALVNENQLPQFFLNDFKVDMKPGYVASQRVTIPPFPQKKPDLLKTQAQDVFINHRVEDLPDFWAQDVYKKNGDLRCCGADAILGVMTNYGETMEDAVSGLYKKLDNLDVAADLQYRTDGLERPTKVMATLRRWGFTIR